MAFIGVHGHLQANRSLLVVEYLFGLFVMAYVNGIQALGYKSWDHNKYKKMPSTEKWEQALIIVEQSQEVWRDATRRVNYQKYNEAEQLAKDGLGTLKERSVVFINSDQIDCIDLIFSLSKLPHGCSQEKPLEAIWPGDKYVEECFDPMNSF